MNQTIEITLQALAEKDQKIKGLQQKISDLEKQNSDLDYLLTSWKHWLTNERLLTMLGKRIATGQIKRELSSCGNYLIIENKQGMFKVDLHDGQLTEPNKEVNHA